MQVQYRRLDGSFVATVNGLPYHIIESDPLFAEAQIAGEDAPFEPGPPPPTPEQMQAAYTDAIKAHVEATAQARGYSSALSCASYAGSTVPAWQAEGAAFMIWRDDVWEAALAMLAAVQAGGAIPESPIAGLPEMVWPA